MSSIASMNAGQPVPTHRKEDQTALDEKSFKAYIFGDIVEQTGEENEIGNIRRNDLFSAG